MSLTWEVKFVWMGSKLSVSGLTQNVEEVLLFIEGEINVRHTFALYPFSPTHLPS